MSDLRSEPGGSRGEGSLAMARQPHPPGGPAPARYRYAKDVLDSGLRVVTVEVPHLHTAMLALYVRAGSRHETPEDNGISHFLEHMYFRGSEGFPDGRAMNALVEDAGGALNGVTTRDHGYYYTPIHPDHADVGLAVLGDMLARPQLKEIELEREVVLEEILDDVDDKGRDIDVDNLGKRSMFGDHPLGMKIGGTQETVRSLTNEQLRAHHERLYTAPNMVLAAAGPMSRDRILKLAEQHFAHLRRGGGTPPEARPPQPPEGPRFLLIRHDESQVDVRLTFPAVPESDPTWAAVLLARRLLDDGLSSRLQVEIVDRRGLAYTVHGGLDTFADAALFELDAAATPGKVAALVTQCLRVLGELATTAPSDDELRRAKLRNRINLEFSLDSAGEMAGWFGGTELFRPPEDFPERIAKIERVTTEEVRAAAAAMFRRSCLHCVCVGKLSVKQRREIEQVVDRAEGLPA